MRALVVSAILSLGFAVAPVSAQAIADSYRLNIPRQSLDAALKDFAQQTGLQIARFSDTMDASVMAGPVNGEYSAAQALDSLLKPNGLTYRLVNDRTIAVTKPGEEPELGNWNTSGAQGAGAGVSGGLSASAQTPNTNVQQPVSEESGAPATASQEDRSSPVLVELQEIRSTALPEVLVEGSRSLNADIGRSRDDAQPYVVFERAQLEQSGATNLNEFLRQRLTMNTASEADMQSNSTGGNRSNINLRGLGADETLILIDGRRAPTGFIVGTLSQPDINGIPLAAVERIEVLPTTSSGIYGGSATGGVVNVILRRDYSGVEAKVFYENAFDSDVASRRLDLAAGYSLERGKTNVLIAASLSDQDSLELQDQDFTQAYRRRVLRNNGGNYEALNLGGLSPPLGATTNVRSLSGSDLTLTDGTTLGSPITHVPVGYQGVGSDGGAALVANAGTYNLDWGNSASGIGGGRSSLLNGPTVETLIATLRRQFGSHVEAFMDVGASNNKGHFYSSNTGVFGFILPAGASSNPFTETVIVNFPFPVLEEFVSETQGRRVTGGVIGRLPGEWTIGMDYVWNESRIKYSQSSGQAPTLTAAISDGTLDVLRDLDSIDFESFGPYPEDRTSKPTQVELNDITLRLAGPVFSIAGGPVTLSALLEHREEDFSDGLYICCSSSILLLPARSQSVESAYVEARVPFISERNATTGIHALELQVSARRDDYTTVGTPGFIFNPTPDTPIIRSRNKVNSTDPTVAFRYQPVEAVAVRASWGTGFKPPNVNQLISTVVPAITFGTDPQRGNTTAGPYTRTTGGNPALEPESSESWSAGVIVTPQILDGFRFSIDYTRIKKTENITAFPGGLQALIDNESLFPERIARGPSLPGDDPSWAGPIVAIDDTLFNIASAEVEAYDVQLDYSKTFASAGTFDFFLAATYQTHYLTQLLTTLPIEEGIGLTRSNPLKLKANAGLAWNYRFGTVGWTASYYDSYLVADPASPSSTPIFLSQGSRQVPSQTYHDVFGVLRFDEWFNDNTFLKNSELQLGVHNVFNTKPPFEASAQSFGYYSTYGDPRLARYWASFRMQF